MVSTESLNHKLVRCSRCLFPETYETLEFDHHGVCSVCRSIEQKHEIDWDARKEKFFEIIARYKGANEYDCLLPFSGGKDSTYQLLFLTRDLGLKPLVVRFNHGFIRSTIASNVTRTLNELGVDFIDFRPNWRIVKLLMRESFERKTDFCWHCHTGIYAYPLRLAVKFNIPLVFYGEPLAEFNSYFNYADTEVDTEDLNKFNLVRTLGIDADDMYTILSSKGLELDKRDLLPFTYPDEADVRRVGLLPLTIGSFFKWDHVRQTERIKKELGWQSDQLEGVPIECNPACEKIECFMQGPRDYIKFAKRGYSRITQTASAEIRSGRLSREDGIDWLKSEGRRPRSVEILKEFLGIDEQSFRQIISEQAIFPYEHDFDSDEVSDEPWDSDQFSPNRY